MYVWKNQNHRDRRKRPRPPMGYKAAPPAKVDMSSRVERDEQLKVEARRKFAEQEEHEVRIQTRDIKQLMDDYLRTKHGRQELLHVADAMRREQERAEALKKKQEQEAEEEKKRAAAEEKELEKAYKQREKKEASMKKAQHKAREKLRRKGLLAEDAPTADMFEEKFFDVSLTEVPEKKRKRIIQELRAVTRFSLKQATDAAERVPWTIKSSLTREAADAVVKRLSRAGAGVELVAGKKPAADEASVDSKEADVQFLEAQREKRMLERKKRAAVNMAGVEAADKERQQVQATFSVFDADNSGAIDVGELEGLLKELCIPVKDKDELHAIMTELDGDGSGDIDFHEFYMWFKQVGESKKGGIIGNALSASLAVQKFGNAMAGATRMLEAKRVIIACAEHDAAQHARLLFRQSRPDEGHDGDEVAREVAVDLAAEKRFSAVRAVVGRPTQDGGGGGDNEVPEYEARSLRARRLLYHPDLWPVPPPPPKLVPPHWMNADRPGLSDPFDEAGDAVKLGAKIHGVDPTAGERAAPRASDGMRGMTRHHFLNGKPEKQAPGPGSTFARAIVALRKDIAFPDAARLRPETDAPGVEVVPEGAMKALATFAWRPDMEPRPRRNVSIEAEFTGWKPARLQPSRKRHGAYELEFALPPGRYRYGFRVDGEHHVDPLAPIARTGNGSYNVLHVLAYHRSKQNDALSPPKPKRGEPLEICLNGHRLKDDGAWALADAIRSGGGGGALRVLALQANGLSGDGVGSLCTALASGAALKLESLDLSKNRIGVEGGRAVGLLLSEKWDGNADDADRAVPAPLVNVRLARCRLMDDGAAQVAVGVVGNGTLRNLDLNENGVGEFGCAALARALLRNGVLQSLSLAGNRVDAEGAKHLSVPVRISGALRRLELANNQAVGSLGAYHLGEALAGGSPDLLRRVAAEEEAARHRRGEISIKTLAISGVGSDDDDDDDYKRVGNVDSAASASANNNLRGIIKLKAKANAVKNKAKRKIVRSGTLDYLGLADCSMCREGDRRGIVAVCDGLQRSAVLTSLDLSHNELDDWAARAFAHALQKSQDHNRLKFVSLRGNTAISPEWMWRDHAMPATENDAEAQRTGQLDMLVTVPSIATSIELTRRAVAEHERQQALFLARERRKKDRKMGGGDAKPARARPPSRPTTPGSESQGTEPSGSDGEGEPRAAGSMVDGGDSTTLSTMTASQVEKRASFNRRASRRASMAQRRAARDAIKKPVVEEEDVAEEVDEGIIAPPPPVDPKSGKLEGEWTAVSGWFRMADKYAARAVRREEALRANEYARIQCEKDAVEAAGAAAAARANLAAARVPDGPKLVEAVARELAEVTKAQQKLAAAKVARSRRGAQTDRTIMQEGAAEVAAKLAQTEEARRRLGARDVNDSRAGSAGHAKRRGAAGLVSAEELGAAVAARQNAETVYKKPWVPTKWLPKFLRKYRQVEQTRAKKLQKMISGAGAGDGDGGGEAATAAAAEQTLVADKLALARDRAAIAAIKKAAKDKKREGYREAEKSRIKAIFQRVDTDDSGTVDSFELKALLIRLGWVSVTPKQIRETMKELDRDASGEIDFDELSSWWVDGGGKEKVRRMNRTFRALLLGKSNVFSSSKGERGGVFDPLLQDAVRALEADASYEATKRARSDFRKRRPPRESCVCLVCGEACVDHVNHSLHVRDGKRGHQSFERAETAAHRRRALLDRARNKVAIAARAKEGRAAKKKMSRSEKKKEKKKKEEETRPPFPVLVVYDPRVPHHIEIQTYDIPDKHHGRPTGAVSLLTSALYCIADGLGNDLVTKGAGSEWLRVVWPSHAAAGGGEDASLTTAAAMYGAIHGGPMPRVSRDDDGPPRAVVWLHNRHSEYSNGKEPVFRPLKAGETPYEKGKDQEELEWMELDEEDRIAANKKATWWQERALRKRKARLAKVQAAEEREYAKRQKILGEYAHYNMMARSLLEGHDVELFAKPRWFRCHPGMPRGTRLKVRSIPEVYSAVIGELRWGYALLAYGKARNWLLVAYGPRDNAWLLFKAPTRPFVQQVISTVELTDLRHVGYSPQLVEEGAADRVTGERAKTMGEKAASLAARAETEDIDDDELAAIGDGRKEAPLVKPDADDDASVVTDRPETGRPETGATTMTRPETGRPETGQSSRPTTGEEGGRPQTTTPVGSSG